MGNLSSRWGIAMFAILAMVITLGIPADAEAQQQTKPTRHAKGKPGGGGGNGGGGGGNGGGGNGGGGGGGFSAAALYDSYGVLADDVTPSGTATSGWTIDAAGRNAVFFLIDPTGTTNDLTVCQVNFIWTASEAGSSLTGNLSPEAGFSEPGFRDEGWLAKESGIDGPYWEGARLVFSGGDGRIDSIALTVSDAGAGDGLTCLQWFAANDAASAGSTAFVDNGNGTGTFYGPAKFEIYLDAGTGKKRPNPRPSWDNANGESAKIMMIANFGAEGEQGLQFNLRLDDNWYPSQ